ncbi:MAG: hypothetical protein Q9220_002488 [cf. Caloplaca sp. 1 TL-2023]
MTVLQDALADDTHEFWTEFGKQLDRSPSATIAEIRRAVQEKDDQERKAAGLPPRPWNELEQELEGQSNRFLENFDSEVLKFDERRRVERGEEPRGSVPAVEEEELESSAIMLLSQGLEQCEELMKKVVMKFDAKKRMEMGLEPRSWEAFEEAVEEAFEDEHGLEYADKEDEVEKIAEASGPSAG